MSRAATRKLEADEAFDQGVGNEHGLGQRPRREGATRMPAKSQSKPYSVADKKSDGLIASNSPNQRLRRNRQLADLTTKPHPRSLADRHNILHIRIPQLLCQMLPQP